MNYCTVCKREYKEIGRRQTRQCPVCGSTLVQVSDEELDQVRQEKTRNQ